MDHDDKNIFYDDDGEFIPKANNVSIVLPMHLNAYFELSQKLQLEKNKFLHLAFKFLWVKVLKPSSIKWLFYKKL